MPVKIISFNVIKYYEEFENVADLIKPLLLILFYRILFNLINLNIKQSLRFFVK